MKRFVVSAFLFLLLGQTIGAQNKFALLVGINQYQIKDSSGKIFYFTCCLLLLSCNNGKNEKGDEETKTDDIFIILPDEVIRMCE